MSQSTLSIANGNGRTFRMNINAALQALGSMFYGANDPATLGYVGAGAFWADSGNQLLKQRDAANTAWITKGTLLSDGTIQLAANVIGFTPDGNISSTHVQAAVTELANRFNSGTAFPTANLVPGMLFFRTDLNQLFELKALTPAWVMVFDLNKTATNKEYVDAHIPAFAGTGSATTASRSDHNHDALYAAAGVTPSVNIAGFRLTYSATAPSSPQNGKELWIDMANRVMKIYESGAWVTLGAAYL